MSDEDAPGWEDDATLQWQADVTRRLEVLEEMLAELAETMERIAGRSPP